MKLEFLEELIAEDQPDPQAKAPGAKCSVCPLLKKRCVPTDGPADAKVAVVSRSPGAHDVRKKKPFAGPSGDVLNHLLKLYDYKKEDVLVTNVVLCQHDGPPPKEAIAACKSRLDFEIADADTVIAAGSEAVALLTRRKSLEGTRGYAHERRTATRRQRVVATNNPAIVLRDDSTFPNLVRDFRLALAPLPDPTLPDVDWTNNVSEGRRWLQRIANQSLPLLSADIETRGIRADAPLVALGLSGTGSKAVSFGEQVCSDDYTYRNYIAPLIGGKSNMRYLYHNGKFDVRNLRWHGIDARVDEDTMLLSWILDERSDENQVHKLEYLLMNELNWPNYEPEVVREWKRTVGRLEKQLRFEELYELPTPDELYQYNALDAAGTALLFPILQERAAKDNVLGIYRNILIPASEALVRVELNGTPYNADKAVDLLEDEVWPELDNLRENLRLIVGDGNYNPNSTVQTAKLVYDDWQIIHTLPLKDDRTVDKSVYTEIKAGRFVAGSLDEREAARRNQRTHQTKETAIRWAEKFADFKALDKQRSTYLEGLIPRAVHDGNKLYTSFKLHNTVSGRLSSSGPNLQNITRTKAGLPNIRGLFEAPEGYTMVQVDYSQAELRAIAAISGDAKLSEVYRQNLDLHDVVADRFYGPEFTKEERVYAKIMNFGVAYGQSAMTFQEKNDIPEKEAEKFIKWWWSEFTGVREWTKSIEAEIRANGEVVSPLGYKKRYHLLTKENRNAAIREGINFVPQNVAGVFTISALTELVPQMDGIDAAIVLSVHDSILCVVHDDVVDHVCSLLVSTMEAQPQKLLGWDFPFTADVQTGPDWGSLG